MNHRSLHSPLRCLPLLACLGAGESSAQRTWIVDAAGAGDFTTVSGAVLASGRGDTLLVRPGSYSSTSTISHGLTVVADPGAQLGAGFIVSGLPAGDAVSLVGGLVTSSVRLRNCDGRVHLESVAVTAAGSPGVALDIDDCANVTIDASSFTILQSPFMVVSMDAAVRVDASTVLLTGVSARGEDAYIGGFSGATAAAPGIRASNSTLRLTNPDLRGGDAFTLYSTTLPAAAGLQVTGCDVTVAGDASTSILSGAASPFGQGAGYDLDVSGGSLVYEPNTGLGAARFGGSTSPQARTLDSVLVRSAGPGGTLVVEGLASPGALLGLLLSLPADPVDLPPLGELWLDLPTTLPLAAGVLTSDRLTTSLVIPPSIPRGATLAVQARADRGGVVTISHPAVFALR